MQSSVHENTHMDNNKWHLGGSMSIPMSNNLIESLTSLAPAISYSLHVKAAYQS